MDFIGAMGEMAEAPEINGNSAFGFSEKANDKFDKIMGDDKIDSSQSEDVLQLTREERESKFSKLFDVGDFFRKTQLEQMESTSQMYVSASDKDENNAIETTTEQGSDQTDTSQKREPNAKYELNGDVYETDDNGDTYKKNGVLLPNTQYTVNGNTYRTDEHGNKISCDSEPTYTEDGYRNNKEQKESGGEERQEDDDGGHIIAKILGGAEGEENLVPMRRTINRGDYKKMENEISKALREGKKVTVHIDLEYDEDSHRPSKICAEYIIEGKNTVVEFDNKEGSTKLLDSLNEKISDEDYNNLKDEIGDMKVDGLDVAVTSVKVEYDENGNPTKVTVGILDESTGQKTYKVYNPK